MSESVSVGLLLNESIVCVCVCVCRCESDSFSVPEFVSHVSPTTVCVLPVRSV